MVENDDLWPERDDGWSKAQADAETAEKAEKAEEAGEDKKEDK